MRHRVARAAPLLASAATAITVAGPRAAAAQGPTVTLVAPKLYQNPAQCALDCGELVTSFSTPAYRSVDVARSITLVYRSGRAHAMPVVEFDVAPLSGTRTLGLRLFTPNGAVVTLADGSTQARRSVVLGYNRLAAQVDAAAQGWSGYTTLTAEVTAYGSAGEVLGATRQPVTVLGDGWNDVHSPYGTGWGVAGWQRFGVVPGGLVLGDGSGEVGYWASAGVVNGVATYTSPPGDVTTVTGDGTVLRRRWPDGRVAVFSNGSGALHSLSDRFGNATTFTYQDPNETRLRSVTDPAGKVTSFYYRTDDISEQGWQPHSLAEIVDPVGRATWFGVTTANDLRSLVAPGQPSILYSYTGAHRPFQMTDARGNVWDYAYDAFGRLSSVASPPGAGSGGTTRLTTTFTSWASAVLGAPGAALGSAAPRAAVTGPDGLTTRYLLDGWGAPTRVEAPGGAVATAARDGLGRLTQTANARGGVTTYRWNPTYSFLLDSTYDAAARVATKYFYNDATFFQLQAVVVNGREQQFGWMHGGRVDSVRVGGPDQAPTRYAYASGSSDPRPTSVTDPGKHVTTYTYEAGGLRNTSAVADAAGTTSVARDAVGRDSVVTDPLGRRTVTRYDPANRPTSATDPLGYATATAYDALYARTVTDASGQVYRDSVNALGLPFFSYDPGGAPISTTYDAAGRVASIINRRSQTVSFGYDPTLGFLNRRTTADGFDATYGTDALGTFRAAHTNESTDSVYTDALGRDTLAVHVLPMPGGGTATYTLSYRYDALGRRAGVALAQRGGAALSNVSYHYNAAGRLDSLWDASTAVTALSYDPDGALTSTMLPGSGARTTPPTIFHKANGLRFPSNSVLDQTFGYQIQFDTFGRVQERLTVSGGLAAGPAYGYDAAGQLDSAYTVQYSTAPKSPQCTPYYGNQARFPTSPGEQPTSWYCPNGSPTTRSVSNVTSYVWDEVGNPVRPDAQDSTNSGSELIWSGGLYLSYDADGNMTRRFKPGVGAPQYLWWNSVGQLAAVHNYSDQLHDHVGFGYDGWGRRVRKTDSTTNVATYYIWDGDNLAATVQGGVVARYAYYPGAVDRPHSVTVGPPGQAATTYYYVQDVAPGNVLGLITAGGQVAASYRYDPWGRVTAATESGLGGWSNPLRFGAREYDAETGLYYHRARYYDPTLQRFVSRDPIGLGGGVNWYAYAGNDPVNYRDPSGLSMKADPEPEPQGCQVSYATDLSWMNIDIGGCDFGPDPQPPAGGSGGPHPGEGPAPGGGGNGGGGPGNQPIVRPYKYQALQECPVGLRPGSTLRAALLGLGSTTDNAPEAGAYFFYKPGIGFVASHFGTGGTNGYVDMENPPPRGARAGGHLHPGPYNPALLQTQGPSVPDAIGVVGSRTQRGTGIPEYIASQDSLFVIQTNGRAYGCHQ